LQNFRDIVPEGYFKAVKRTQRRGKNYACGAKEVRTLVSGLNYNPVLADRQPYTTGYFEGKTGKVGRGPFADTVGEIGA